MASNIHSTYRVLGAGDELGNIRYTTDIHIFDTFLYPTDVVEEQWIEQKNPESGLYDSVLVRYRIIRLGADDPCDKCTGSPGNFDCYACHGLGVKTRDPSPPWAEVTPELRQEDPLQVIGLSKSNNLKRRIEL
jgi:hypothetical protein